MPIQLDESPTPYDSEGGQGAAGLNGVKALSILAGECWVRPLMCRVRAGGGAPAASRLIEIDFSVVIDWCLYSPRCGSHLPLPSHQSTNTYTYHIWQAYLLYALGVEGEICVINALQI